MNTTELTALRALDAQCTALTSALADMIAYITSGKHYEQMNPYARPEVRAAMAQVCRTVGLASPTTLDAYGKALAILKERTP